jgi:hypothetical protein
LDEFHFKIKMIKLELASDISPLELIKKESLSTLKWVYLSKKNVISDLHISMTLTDSFTPIMFSKGCEAVLVRCIRNQQ